MKILHPPGWPRPKGYSNGVSARGRTIFTAGVIGWDAQKQFPSNEIAGQFRQIMVNTLAILAEDGAGPEHIVRMTWYVVSRDDYVAKASEIGAIYRELMGRNFPAMAVVQVVALVDPRALLEIETIAMVPD